MNVIVNGLMTNYLKAGRGKPIVMLHGWADSAKTFAGMVEKLKPDYEIYALDLPGFGGTQAPAEAWDLNQYADFVNAWMNKLRLQPYALTGHSYGGAVAIMVASQNSSFKRLVLLASAGVRDKKRGRKLVMKTAAKVAKTPLYLLPEAKRRRVKQKLYGSIGSDIMLLPHMEATYRKMISQDVRQAARQIKLPTLLIYGANDGETPPVDGRLLHQAIAGSSLEIVDGGHFIHQEKADAVASLMLKFLKARS